MTLRKISVAILTAWIGLFLPISSFGSSSGITYQGRILDKAGQPIVSPQVQFLIWINGPTINQQECLLYAEKFTIDMSSGDSGFSLILGGGMGVRTDAGPLPLEKLFNPELKFPVIPQCPSGFAKQPEDKLFLNVSFNAGSGFETLEDPIIITAAPVALDAIRVAGIPSGRVLRVDEDPDAIGLSSNQFALNPSNFNELVSLLNGTSTKYARTSGGTGDISTTGNISTSGNISANSLSTQSLIVSDANQKRITITAPASGLSADYSMALPFSRGNSGQILTSDGTGGTRWENPSSSLTTGVTGVLPVANGGTNSSVALNNNRLMVSKTGSIVEAAVIGASKALVSDADGLPIASAVSSTELGHLSGVTSALQTQLNGKASNSGWANYSVIGVNGAGSMTAVSGSVNGSILSYNATGPFWTTASFPSTTNANQLLYSSANNVVAGLPTSNSAVLTTNSSGAPNWSSLSSDLFTQYASLAGRSGGQTLKGGTAAGESLTLESTDHLSKGNLLINPTGGNVGIGTTAPTARLSVNGSTQVNSSFEGVSSYVNSGAAYTIPDTSVNVRRITLTADATITLPSMTSPAASVFTMTVFLKQDATGGRFYSFAGSGVDVVKWDSGVAPTISPTAGKLTILQFTKISDEAVWYGSMVWREN